MYRSHSALGFPWSGSVVLLVGIALLMPGIGDVVVAAFLPEAAPIGDEVLDRADPLDALPRVQVRHHHADRGAVLGGQGLAVAMGGQQRRRSEEVHHPYVRAVAVLRPDHDMGGVRCRWDEAGDRGREHA